jgi:hypothetical protein
MFKHDLTAGGGYKVTTPGGGCGHMQFTTEHTEHLVFTKTLCNAIRKLYDFNYFSHLDGTHKTRHWDLIDMSLQLTDKGRQFARGEIGVERLIVVTPKIPWDPDPDILRGDEVIFIGEYDRADS